MAFGVRVLAALLESHLILPPTGISPIGLVVFQEFSIKFKIFTHSDKYLSRTDTVLTSNALVPLGSAEVESTYSV